MKKLFTLLLIGTSFYLSAEDLGVVAKIYPIVEPDMIEWIKQKAAVMMKNGDWDKIQKQAIIKAKNNINHPIPVASITDAVADKTWYYKPMIEVKQDLTDSNGHVIARAGRYNALRYKPFAVQLVFINGNNQKQVDWAIRHNNTDGIRTKIILTQGSFMDLEKKHKIWFYYDQNGKYTQKLNIAHVPAIVSQDGDQLKISELDNNKL